MLVAAYDADPDLGLFLRLSVFNDVVELRPRKVDDRAGRRGSDGVDKFEEGDIPGRAMADLSRDRYGV